ncbi:MAG: shikimate dehydrogenase [Bacteroidetes bacterium]|nr:shikimate dehydrogenase [Bacteroidota bacterium]
MQEFGLIGKQLSHSFSKNYFTAKFENEKILNCSYSLFELKNSSEIPSLISSNPNLIGLNITIPFKKDVLAYLDFQSPEVKEIGAANTIKIKRYNQSYILEGYNTDAYGFEYSLLKLLPTKNISALVLGTGGASNAVCYVLKKNNINYTLVSRTKKSNTFIYSELTESIIRNHALIINTTPLGMYPNVTSYPPIPYQYLTAEHVLFDLIYNPEETLFLKQGKLMGTKTSNGLEMLEKQAEKAWEIWQE